MGKALIPKSRAKTAYGLLSEIRTLILDEPKRYNQETTLRRASIHSAYGFDFPACGTIGCVAGWTIALKAPRNTIGVCVPAREILGLTEGQAINLFASDAVGDTNPQTKAHAKAGAKHIARFQKANRAQLLAKKV